MRARSASAAQRGTTARSSYRVRQARQHCCRAATNIYRARNITIAAAREGEWSV